MSDVARLPFVHADGEGALVLSDDGTVRVEPSEDLRDALALPEERALATARLGAWGGLGLIGLGLAAVAAGWYAGRVGGKHAWRQIAARSVRNVRITPTGEGRWQARLGSAIWDVTVQNPSDAKTFLAALGEMRGEA